MLTNSGWWGETKNLRWGEGVHQWLWTSSSMIMIYSDLWCLLKHGTELALKLQQCYFTTNKLRWLRWLTRYLRTSYQQKRDTSDTRMALILDDHSCSDHLRESFHGRNHRPRHVIRVCRVSWHVDFCRTRNIVPDSLKLSTPEIPEDLGQFRRDPHSNYKKQKQLESKWHVTHGAWIKWANLADFLQNRMICLFTCNITMMFDARGFSELGQTQSFSALDAFLVPAIRGPTCPWHVHLWNLETPLGARSMLRWMMP